jgi:hypothetical protein
LFNIFYIHPEYNSEKYHGPILEDSISVDVGTRPRPFYFFEIKVNSDGFLNLHIELPVDSGEVKTEDGKIKKRYSYIKYLMARKKGE